MDAESQPVPQHTADVTVFTGSGEALKQPTDFRFCPLGFQFYSDRRMDECSILEMTLDLPLRGRSGGPVRCCGMVVNCIPADNPSRYRVWVKFLDLPDPVREEIQCLSRTSDFLCPYCQNF